MPVGNGRSYLLKQTLSTYDLLLSSGKYLCQSLFFNEVAGLQEGFKFYFAKAMRTFSLIQVSYKLAKQLQNSWKGAHFLMKIEARSMLFCIFVLSFFVNLFLKTTPKWLLNIKIQNILPQRSRIIYLPFSFFSTTRSSHQRCSMKKGVLKIFTKFTGKHLRQNLYIKKIVGLRPATLFKKRLQHSCLFPVNFTKFFRTPFSQNTPGRLLLYYCI